MSYVDIGHGVSIERRSMPGNTLTDGVAIKHPDGKGGVCEGWVNINGRYPGRNTVDGWDLINEEPLTLSPSILCRACGHHGYIRDGKWVPA